MTKVNDTQDRLLDDLIVSAIVLLLKKGEK